MKQHKTYTVELRCDFSEWWRYNVEMMCAAFDEEGTRIGFTTASSRIAEVGANLKTAPAESKHRPSLALTTPPCHHAQLFLYVIPHTLPEGNRVEDSAPFELETTLHVDGIPRTTERHTINQWSGASLCFDFND